jgi:integrase
VLLPVVTVAVNTGMRKGEILGLTWERVDFARGVLRLEETKSGRRREIPMNQAVDAALARLAGPKAEGLVFRKRDGSEWGSIRTAFEAARRAAKIEAFRFHDLRHTFASHFMMSTGDLPVLQKPSATRPWP